MKLNNATEKLDQIIASGLDAEEIEELRDWYCYTKPIGPSIKIAATPAHEGSPGLFVLSAGTEPGSCEYAPG